MARTDSLDQIALAYIGERYPEWIARYRTNEDHSGPKFHDSINMLCQLEDAAKEIAELKAERDRWHGVADALCLKLTGVTAEGLVVVPANATAS